MKKIVRALAICGILAIAGQAFAETYADLKTGLIAALPQGQKVFKLATKITAPQAKFINGKWGGDFAEGDDLTWYYSKDTQGKVSGYAIEMVEVLDQYSAYHRWVIGFKADKTVSKLTILELTNDHTYNMARGQFQAQFQNKDPAKLKLSAGVDAVTGATQSCQLLVESIQRAAYLLSQTAFN